MGAIVGLMPDRPYRLSIARELESFRPELEYAAAFLDRCHLVERRDSADTVLHYGHGAPPGAVAVPAALFPGCARLDSDGIHPRHDALASAQDAPATNLLPPVEQAAATNGGAFPYDALGLIFFMLARLEERGYANLDRYRRFPYGASLMARTGSETDPLADRAARDLAAALLGTDRPDNRTVYRVEPTHDVDRLRGYHRPLQPLRQAAGDLVKRRRPKTALRRLRQAYLDGEPWRSIRDLMDISESLGLTSRFFFLGPSSLSMDSPYAETMPALLREVAAEIATRGHVVGFHPGFATPGDAQEWQRQRRGLERAIDRPVTEGRQHVLGYVADRTPEIWNDAGMKRDYTLAFPDAVGFRSGTCRPFQAYSLVRRRPLDLEQIATPIMDFGLLDQKYCGLEVDAALDACRPALDACRRYGGTLAILYHTGQARGPAWRFYTRLLGMAR